MCARFHLKPCVFQFAILWRAWIPRNLPPDSMTFDCTSHKLCLFRGSGSDKNGLFTMEVTLHKRCFREIRMGKVTSTKVDTHAHHSIESGSPEINTLETCVGNNFVTQVQTLEMRTGSRTSNQTKFAIDCVAVWSVHVEQHWIVF